MIKEVLIIMLQWIDPTVQVYPTTVEVHACPPLEDAGEAESIERGIRGMDDMGKKQPGEGMIVDPYGVLSSSQRQAIQNGASRVHIPGTGER